MKPLIYISLALVCLCTIQVQAQTAKKKQPVKHKQAQPQKHASTQPAGSTHQLKYFNGGNTDFKVEMRSKHIAGVLFIHNELSRTSQAFEQKVLKDTSVARVIDSCKMIVGKMNAEDDPYGAMSYEIKDIPALILFDNNGREIDKMFGYHNTEEVKRFLRQAVQ